MTVMILNPMGGEGWGGVERWFLDTALGLRRRGHRVVSVGRPGSLWAKRCLEAGLPTRTTEMRNGLPLGEARAIAFFAREEKVDVICTKLHKGIRLSGLAAMFLRRVPVVAFMGLVEVKRGLRYRLTYRLFLDRILTLSPGMRRDILAVGGVPEESVEAVPYGVDPADHAVPPAAAAEARRSLGAGPGDPLVVSLGRLHEQKRFDLMLEGFAKVRERVPAARLAVAGTGTLLPELEAKRRALGLDDAVRFAGFRSDTAAVIAAGDLFALSSDDEGLPHVILEAMAAGKAVVATDVGSVRDLVEDRVTGRVVPRRDPGAWAEAVADLLVDGERRRAMGEAALARVRERYPPEKCLAETEEFLLRAAWLDDPLEPPAAAPPATPPPPPA